MAFDLEKLFVDVFAPRPGDVVTVLVDLPTEAIPDNDAWHARRHMAKRWHKQIAAMAPHYGLLVHPIVTYPATGANNADLPAQGTWRDQPIAFEQLFHESTIVIAMTEFSATAPLMHYASHFAQLRVASMPTVAPDMQETALAADYARIAETCARLAPLFEAADGVEVEFSTGHVCFFDISNRTKALQDNGRLHPEGAAAADRVLNLPSGEVCVCPREGGESRTAGEIPVVIDGEQMVFVVEANEIIDVRGEGPGAPRMLEAFAREKALRNIAEVAIGCNDRAVVTGNVLEDEKAGFHWAYGRSEHLGGAVGPDQFSSPGAVCHQDIVYAAGSPIVCKRLDFLDPDGSRHTVIVDGVLQVSAGAAG